MAWLQVRILPVAPVYASMMEEVVIPDLKSDAFLGVPVRVWLLAPSFLIGKEVRDLP